MAKISKVVYGGQTLIDLTQDTITPDSLLAGFTAHGGDGEVITGTCDFDLNTSELTAAASEILEGKTAGVKGVVVTGMMPRVTNSSVTIVNLNVQSIPRGYHDGSTFAEIAYGEQQKIIPENIREGISILGVEGAMSGTEDAKPQAKTVTPTKEAQEVLPDAGYNYLSSVTVNAIPYTETNNAAGGITVTIL